MYFNREFQDDVDALAARALQLKEEANKKAQEQKRLEREQIQRDLEEKLRQIDEEAKKKAAESAAEAKRQAEAQKQSSSTVYDGYHGQTFNYGGGSTGDDPMNAKDYYSWEDFYEDHWMDFGGPDDAEMYYDDHR